MKKLVNDEMMKILKMQSYPFEQEPYLKLFAADFAKLGLPHTLIKAYHLGVIMGKRAEREKRIGKC